MQAFSQTSSHFIPSQFAPLMKAATVLKWKVPTKEGKLSRQALGSVQAEVLQHHDVWAGWQPKKSVQVLPGTKEHWVYLKFLDGQNYNLQEILWILKNKIIFNWRVRHPKATQRLREMPRLGSSNDLKPFDVCLCARVLLHSAPAGTCLQQQGVKPMTSC